MPAFSRIGLTKIIAHKIKQGFTLLTCSVVALQPMMVELANAQEIIIDPSGNVGFAPKMQSSGRPAVVDIAKPNAGGVSHNKYTRFDVTSKGAVLNNSQTATGTQLAGTVAGNTNLTDGTASTIVNEVTSTAKSTLNGSIEVAGSRASVIIANPNGIACNGCNFINASNGTLTTGVPVISGGNVQLNVTQGAITIGRAGLNGAANNVSNINLIGRTVVIDGKVTAIDGINVQGGAQSYDLTNQRRASTLAGVGTVPDFAVDGTEYGAMEAGRIQIIGNERGLGVRVLGAVQSTASDVTVINDGNTTVRSVSAQGRVKLQASTGDLTVERDVSSATADVIAFGRENVVTTDRTGFFGQTGVSVSAANRELSFAGVIQSGADITLFARRDLNFGAYGSATGTFSLKSFGNIVLDGATIVADQVVGEAGSTDFTLSDSAIFSTLNFSIATGDFHLGDNVVVDGLTESDVSNLVVAASGNFHNVGDMRAHDAAVITYAGNLYNEVGGIIEAATLRIAFDREIHNSGILSGVNAIDLDVAALFNNETGLILSKRVDITTTGVLRNDGTISSDGDVLLTSAGSILNNGYIQGIRAYLTAPQVAMGGGSELRVRDYGRIIASTGFSNLGVISSTASFDFTVGQFSNSALMSVETNLSVVAATITNNDAMTAGGTITLRATGLLSNLGTIASYTNAALASDTLVENQGTILADNSLSISGPWFDNKGTAALVRAKTGAINTARIRNSGSVFLITAFQRRNNIDFFENGGVFAALGGVEISGRDASSRIALLAGSALIAGLQPDDETQELLLGKSVTLSATSLGLDGRVIAGGSIALSGPTSLVVNGVIEARQNVSLTADNITITDLATVQANGAALVTASTRFTNNGAIALGNYIRLGGGLTQFTNAGFISSAGTDKFTINGNFENTGVFQSTTHLTIAAQNITNRGHLQSAANMNLAARLTSVNALGETVITLGSIYSSGSMSSGAYTFLTGSNVRLDTSSYLASEQLIVRADTFHMRGRAVLTGAIRNDWTIAQDYRQYGTLFSEGALRISASSYQSYEGSLLGSSDYVTLNVANAANLGGSLTADRVTVTASSIASSVTSSVFSSDDLRLTAASGKISNFGELVSGDDLYITSNEFDIRGNTFADRVHLDATIRGYTRGNLYATETVGIDVTAGQYYNYGLTEARNKLTITAASISNYDGAKLASTELQATATGAISNAGEVFGASKTTLKAGSTLTNQITGKMTGVSLGVTADNFNNYGALDLYGFFGNVENTTQNFGTIATETYFGLDTHNLYNRPGAVLTSGDHVYVKATGLMSNYDTARLEGTTIDLRVGALTNSGAIKAADVVNIAGMTGALSNAATGSIYGKTIALLAGTTFRNDGRIGQRGNNQPKAETVYVSAGTTAANYGKIESIDLSVRAQSSIVNYDLLRASAGTLGLKSETSYVTNLGDLNARDAVVEAGGTFDNQSSFKASETITVSAGADIRNRNINGSFADIGAKTIVLAAAGAISNSDGKIFGYQSLGMQAGSGSINNSGQITGPDITLISKGGGVYSTAGITAGGTLAIEARAIGLRGRVSVADQVTLKSTHYDIEVDDRIDTKRLLVDAARHIESNGAAFRGTELTQLVADDIRRLDGNVSTSTRTRKLAVIAGAQKDIYVQLRQGDLGILGASIYEPAGHSYDAVNWDVTGSVSLIADVGNILLNGTIRTGADLYVKAGDSAILGAGTFESADVSHIEGARFLKNYGGAQVFAGNKVQLIQNSGRFYTDDWLTGDLTYSLSVQAKTIVVNSSHRLINKDIYLVATDDIKQKDQVISARQITYSAGRDVSIEFDPFIWRAANTNAEPTGSYWDVASSGLQGRTLLSQGKGTAIYAGRDVLLKSGILHSGGNLDITATRNIISEPVYRNNTRADVPIDVGWDFSGKYRNQGYWAPDEGTGGYQKDVTGGSWDQRNGVSPDNFYKVKELRAYHNQLSATGNIHLLAGGTVDLVGTSITSSNGNLKIEGLGGVRIAAAFGYREYKDTWQYQTGTSWNDWQSSTVTITKQQYDDILRASVLSAKNGNIEIASEGDVLSAGTRILAGNDLVVKSRQANIFLGTYLERHFRKYDDVRVVNQFWGGGSTNTSTVTVDIPTGNNFVAGELLDISAKYNLTIVAGSLEAQHVKLEAGGNLNIFAAIAAARQTSFIEKKNLITITTIQSGYDRETAALPEIYAPNVSFNISGETVIQGYSGPTLNSQLINLIGARTFDNATLGLSSAEDLASAQETAAKIDDRYTFNYDLPGASDGQQFAYLDTLIQDYGATYNTISLRNHEWYDKQVRLTPAFKALLQAVATYITGGINFGIGNAFVQAGVEAATTNLIVGVVEGTITGNFDLDDVLRGALLAGASATISSYLSDQINWGAGLSDQSPFANAPQFSPAAIVDRAGDRVISQVVSNVVYGQDPFEGFDNLGRTFLVSETMALAQFGVGELGAGNANWEGSVEHLILHGGIGCLAIEIVDGDCVSGFFAGVASGALAGSNLTDEQKLELAPLLGSIVGYFTSGGNAINVSFGGTISQSAIVNNYLSHKDLANLQADLKACRASSDGCEDEERFAIIERYREISRQRDIEYYMCYTESCRIEHIAQMASVDDLRLAIGGDSIVGVELYLHGQHGLEVPNWLTDAVSLNIQNEARIRAECPSRDPQCVVQVISDIQGDNALYNLIASIPGPDLAIAGYECVTGGDALACVALAIEARTRLDIPRGQVSNYVDDVFSGTGIDPDQYYDYVRRKLDDDGVPITPEDYRDFIQFRNGINQQHQTAVNGLDRSLDGQGLITQTEVTLVGSNGTRARTDIVVSGQPGQTVDIPSGYTLEDLNGNPVLDGAGNPVSQVTLDTNGLANFEVKTGNACLTSNQSCVYNMQVNGGEVVAVGENAGSIVPNGTAPSAVYVVREN